jgi:hypothetical protein
MRVFFIPAKRNDPRQPEFKQIFLPFYFIDKVPHAVVSINYEIPLDPIKKSVSIGQS